MWDLGFGFRVFLGFLITVMLNLLQKPILIAKASTLAFSYGPEALEECFKFPCSPMSLNHDGVHGGSGLVEVWEGLGGNPLCEALSCGFL